ncbi:AAA family ATPase [Haliovirga abyssi]|uniref:AAA-ATPase-like domain-containing protein n=1 Tax=Haliovirga abyssi TaxID=2996794 RepID=A0AAU9DD02_9FUSO|nr:AAA family ATPase [Haliovirga abyssi]BDU51396.1 hypothetical protein HLVA_19650 [Haliovirga abyssi]
MRKRIPYGISNFEKLVKEDYYFVDKTKYIELLENMNEPYLIFLRPRRFGKSLLISILENYYDINNKDKEDLFRDLYIGENPTRLKNSYYILKFSFSGIDTRDEKSTEIGFVENVKDGIIKFCNKYKVKHKIEGGKSAEILKRFLTDMEDILDKKIYLLIDEYDHFANEILGFNYNFFSEAVSKNGFVRKFYEEIKDRTASGIVDRIFITGVTPITLDSLTSGFNIATNITVESEFNNMLGFTKSEVKKLFEDILPEYDIEQNMEKLKNYYDGYKFNRKAKEYIYNSTMIMYYVSNYQRKGEEEELVDSNVVSDYKKMANLFRIGGELTEDRRKVLEKLINGEEQSLNLTRVYNLSGKFNIEDFKSLLFYMGFLSISKVDILGRIYVKVPNYVIKELYFEYFQELINESLGYEIEYNDIEDAIVEIGLDGKIDKLTKLTEEVLLKLSNRDFIKFDEKYIKIIMLMFLYRSNIYYVKTEEEVEKGYIDIILKKGVMGKPRYYGIIELKYIKKSDYEKYGDKLIEEKLGEGKEQLKKYEESEEVKQLEELGKVKKWIVVFVGWECKRIEDI